MILWGRRNDPSFCLKTSLAEIAHDSRSGRFTFVNFSRTITCMKKVQPGNRMAALGTSSDAVDAYIAAVPEPTRTTLVRLREIIRSAVPKETVEVISYGIPAFSYPSRFLALPPSRTT